MTDTQPADDLGLAFELAELAAEVAVELFKTGMETAVKPDGTPVSSADFEVERQLILRLSQQRPDDGVLSEEGGGRNSGRRRWILDPIDGTVNFVAGNPHWGTHLALEENGELTIGIITRPLQGQQWWAARGAGAHRTDIGPAQMDSPRLRVSNVKELSEAKVAVWPVTGDPIESAIRSSSRWVESDWTILLRLLAGGIDAVVARAGGVWDHAPGVVLVEEAGGRFYELDGGTRIDAGGALYTNGHVDSHLLRLVRDGRDA